MKLQDLFDDCQIGEDSQSEQLKSSAREKRKGKWPGLRRQLKLARSRHNNPAPDTKPEMTYDGEGDMSDDALTNF